MGKRGPSPTPTPILKLRGSWRSKTRPQEPPVESQAPAKPEGLTPAAAAVWDELVPRLEAAGVVTPIDGRAFLRYCELWNLWNELQAFLKKSGHAHPVKDPKTGEIKGVGVYPQVRLSLQVSEALLRLEQEFGLTPSARAGVKADPSAPPTPAYDFFGGGRR